MINLPIILYNTLYAELDTKGLQFSTLALDFGQEAYIHLDNLSKCIRLGLPLQIEDGCCKKFPTLTLIVGQEAFFIVTLYLSVRLNFPLQIEDDRC